MKNQKILIVTWLLLVITGVGYLDYYKNSPGALDVSLVSQWPKLSKIPFDSRKPQLLLFVHPKCSCSVASLTEFSKLARAIGAKAVVRIIFSQPKGMKDQVENSDLWKQAKDYSGIDLIADREGGEQFIFGVKTSGETILFDENGKKIFHGGITPSRGHEGDSKGQDYILSWFKGLRKERNTASVYGCGIEGNKK